MDLYLAALPPAISISDVERDTGLAKETLRVWERRYAFPQPLRDAGGERLYPVEQVLKLRLVKRLLDLGYRPGKLMRQSTDQLRALASGPVAPRAAPALKRAPVNGATAAAAAAAPAPPVLTANQKQLATLMQLCTSHQIALMRQRLSDALLLMGLTRFVTELVAPLTGLVDEAWSSGQLALYEEHLYSESLQMVLRSAIFAHLQRGDAIPATPRILLTTLPQERNGLGLLMAEAMCTATGAHCIALGTQTPLTEIAAAAVSKRADIIVLSFSSVIQRRQAIDGLTELRARLPASTQLWAGGNGVALDKRPPPFITLLGLTEICDAISAWRHKNSPGHDPAH